MSSRVAKSLVIVLVAVACFAGLALAARPGGGGCPQPKPNCVCAAIYDPVVCDGGCTYSNSCVAHCAGARNCVSSGGGPIEVSATRTEEATAAPPAIETADAAVCPADPTPALEVEGPGFADELVLEAAAGRGCKQCKDRPWCHCTYNGLPRVSCNPCCYGNLGIPQVCLD